MKLRDTTSERIRRLRRRYLDEKPFISAERAKFYTESWRETERGVMSRGVRVARAMKNVYENMGMHVDPDDRIAGTWTEHFLGVPLDVERGLFNDVIAVELDQARMMLYRLETGARFASFMAQQYDPLSLIRTAKDIRSLDVPMPDMGPDTMDKRRVNPYRIRHADKRLLRESILPYWKGRCIAHRLPARFVKSGLYDGNFRKVAKVLSLNTSHEATIISTGAALGTWQGHLILDHEPVLKIGLAGMLEKAEDVLRNDNDLTAEQRDFVRSVVITLQGVIVYARRLAGFVKEARDAETDPARRAVLVRMFEDCSHAPVQPARSFHQAVQAYWTVKTAVELAMPFNVHAPGRLDQLFRPWYDADIAAGRITREQAVELLEELFLRVMSHNMRPYSNLTGEYNQRYEGSEPVTLGGLTRDGRDATCDLTYAMLDAAERSKASLNFVVRLHKGAPEQLIMKVADLYYHGTSSVSMMNDDISIKAMTRRGFSREDAQGYAITGCVDMVAPGKTGGEGFSSLLLSRVLDITLRNGDSKTLFGLVRDVGLKTGDPDSFASFDQLVDAFIAQCADMIRKIVKASRIRDHLYAQQLPCPAISTFMQGCMEKRKDVTRGGAVYDLEGILIMNSIANVTDSLYVIKKLIFEQKEFTFKELLEALDSNFRGHERIRGMVLNVDGKWGNGNPETDELARRITTAIFEETYKYETYKGGWYAPFINSMTSHTMDGRMFMATPDGRPAGTPFAASCNPYNVEKNGPTGVLRSVAALDFEHVLGCAVNIRLHPSAIGATDEARRKWASLVRTYFEMGGEQLQPTVVSTEVLRAAQQDPDNYRNIIVKVGGYSAYFTDLGREIQNEIISRTEHSMS